MMSQIFSWPKSPAAAAAAPLAACASASARPSARPSAPPLSAAARETIAASACFYSYLYQRTNPFSLFITAGMYLRVPLLARWLAWLLTRQAFIDRPFPLVLFTCQGSLR